MEGYWTDLLLLLAIVIAVLAILNPIQGWTRQGEDRADGDDGRPPTEPPRPG